MHEEDDDKGGFDGCNQECDNRIKRTEVDESGTDSGRGQDEQGYADRQVESLRVSRVLVFDLFLFWVLLVNHGDPQNLLSV